jgi:hypothetical protein
MTAATKLSGARVLKRNPAGSSKLDGGVGIELGRVLELEVGGQVIRMGRKRVPLLWFPAWKSLVFFEGVSQGRATAAALRELETAPGYKRAVKSFDSWANRGTEKARGMTFPKGQRKWYAGGTVSRIDYWSDKWGREDEYTHDHGKGVQLYILQRGKTAMWVIKGGRLRVTKRGIEG